MTTRLGGDSIDIDNVVLFIADSVRYDYAPVFVKEIGTTFKTISQSIYTAPSIPSILTGMYPMEHGVQDFSNQLSAAPEILSLLDSGINFDKVWTHIPDDQKKPIFRVLNLGKEHLADLDSLEEPFLYVEHHKGGHPPYGPPRGGWGSVKDFFEEYSRKPHELPKLYQSGVETAGRRFLELKRKLEERELDENTLMIFTSDHGELLGDRGLFNHGHPMCPELVYTPTIFVGPGVEAGVSGGTIRHVDLIPTIASSTNADIGRTQGKNLWGRTLPISLTGFSTVLRGTKINYKARSIWDGDGGYVIHDNSFIDRFLFTLHRNLISGPESPITRRNLSIKGLYCAYLKKRIRYGTPEMDEDKAYDELATLEHSLEKQEIDKELREQLEQWGYI